MRKCWNVIYRNIGATTHFRCSARRTAKAANQLAADLMGRGWDVIIDPDQPMEHAMIDAPIVDVGRVMKKHTR